MIIRNLKKRSFGLTKGIETPKEFRSHSRVKVENGSEI